MCRLLKQTDLKQKTNGQTDNGEIIPVSQPTCEGDTKTYIQQWDQRELNNDRHVQATITAFHTDIITWLYLQQKSQKMYIIKKLTLYWNSLWNLTGNKQHLTSCEAQFFKKHKEIFWLTPVKIPLARQNLLLHNLGHCVWKTNILLIKQVDI